MVVRLQLQSFRGVAAACTLLSACLISGCSLDRSGKGVTDTGGSDGRMEPPPASPVDGGSPGSSSDDGGDPVRDAGVRDAEARDAGPSDRTPLDCGSDCPCQSETWRGTTYLLCRGRAGWDEAREHCMEYGGDLAIIDDADENEWAKGLAADSGHEVWIGLTDRDEEGVFQWVDGSPVAFEDWGDDQPDDWRGEDCGLIRGEQRDWNDDDCDERERYLCEPPAG